MEHIYAIQNNILMINYMNDILMLNSTVMQPNMGQKHYNMNKQLLNYDTQQIICVL